MTDFVHICNSVEIAKEVAVAKGRDVARRTSVVLERGIKTVDGYKRRYSIDSRVVPTNRSPGKSNLGKIFIYALYVYVHVLINIFKTQLIKNIENANSEPGKEKKETDMQNDSDDDSDPSGTVC
jgi:hypothetical protein